MSHIHYQVRNLFLSKSDAWTHLLVQALMHDQMCENVSCVTTYIPLADTCKRGLTLPAFRLILLLMPLPGPWSLKVDPSVKPFKNLYCPFSRWGTLLQKYPAKAYCLRDHHDLRLPKFSDRKQPLDAFQRGGESRWELRTEASVPTLSFRREELMMTIELEHETDPNSSLVRTSRTSHLGPHKSGFQVRNIRKETTKNWAQFWLWQKEAHDWIPSNESELGFRVAKHVVIGSNDGFCRQ